MDNEAKYTYKEVKLKPKMTEKGRKNILNKTIEKMAKDGWEIEKHIDEGMAKPSKAIFRRDINYKMKRKNTGYFAGLLKKIFKWIIYLFLGLLVLSYMVPKTELTPEQNKRTATKKQEKIKHDLKKEHLQKTEDAKKAKTSEREIRTEKKQQNKMRNIKKSKEKPFTETSDNMKKVIRALKKYYNIEATDGIDRKINESKMCWNDRACEIFANKVQIQGIYKTVDALTSSRVSPKYYQNVCSAIMIALTGTNKKLIESQIPQYFNYASQHGRSRWKALGIEITISVDSDGLLGCEFYKK